MDALSCRAVTSAHTRCPLPARAIANSSGLPDSKLFCLRHHRLWARGVPVIDFETRRRFPHPNRKRVPGRG